MPDGPSELIEFKAKLASLADRVLAVDIRAYESMPPDQLASELQPVVTELLTAANALIADVLDAYGNVRVEAEPGAAGAGALSSPYAVFEHAIDAAIAAQTTSSLQAVGDIAFLAHLELRQRAARLEHVTWCRSAIAIVGECDSALRRVRKALTSIDVAFARAGIGEATFDFASELEVSLRVRRACAKLRGRVLAAAEPSEETLYVRLRSAGTAIAMLVGWEVYPSLRVRDRLQLRELQRRILDWLRQDKDPTAGLRLWQDLVTFIRMLSQVNRRQELVEHDTRTVLELADRLATVERESLSDDALDLLASLEGLDDEVDQLLASRSRSLRDAWREPIARLARTLRGPGAAR
ncbi:MAG: hypothetical protein KIS83_21470 [Rubrivivax sp.]|nr:hypothetical protein [Labilithrix sp.]MCW5613217.1 hypothetical protein [Rubrivivax sp.]MCW5833676.1 hypothetical protein [Labilithrix sp.]